MALNYREKEDIQSAVTASKNSDAIDLAGFSKLAIQVVFGTCTGVIASSGQYVLQTSNNINGSWTTMTGDIKVVTSGATLNNTTVFKHFPDNATADETGFGRWVRFRMIVTGSPSLSYTTYWHAKQ